jgi:hypothetical protein
MQSPGAEDPRSSVPRRKPVSMHSFTSENNSIYTMDTEASDAGLLKGFREPSIAETVPNEPRRPQQNSTRWGLPDWNPLWSMYLFFILGVGFAIGHHVFYQSLAGREATDQLQMLRYGTVLAYLTKACLVTSVIIAYRQRMWYTFRSQPLTVATIDGLFAAVEDLTAMLNWEAMTRAKIAMLLAAAIW